MNKIYNQSNEIIDACGTSNSPIRCKTQFNITFPKLLDKLQSNWCRGGLDRHTEPNELFDIMSNDNIPKEYYTDLFYSVYFYFNDWLKTNNPE